ncbi:MAG: hypothetical protein ACFE68_02895 [Candidatus Hodarchaeota archaeon]
MRSENCLQKEEEKNLNSILIDNDLTSLPLLILEQVDHDLTTYEEQVLTVLAEDPFSEIKYSFQGLKRRLEIHQQKLAKALKRALEKGLIERTKEGFYFLTPQGRSLISTKINKKTATLLDQNPQKSGSFLQVEAFIETEMIDHKPIVEQLIGKYWGVFRFLSHYNDHLESSVAWITTDGSHTALFTVRETGTAQILIRPLTPDTSRMRKVFDEFFNHLKTLLEKKFGAQLRLKSTNSHLTINPCLN